MPKRIGYISTSGRDMKAKYVNKEELWNGRYNVSKVQREYLEYITENNLSSMIEDTAGFVRLVSVGGNIYPILFKQDEKLSSYLSLSVCLQNALIFINGNKNYRLMKPIFKFMWRGLKKMLSHQSCAYMVEIDNWLYMNVEPNASLANDLEAITLLLSKKYKYPLVVKNIDATEGEFGDFTKKRGWCLLPYKVIYEYVPEDKITYCNKRKRKLREYREQYGIISKKKPLNEKNIEEFLRLISLSNERHSNINKVYSRNFLLFCSRKKIIQTDFITDESGKIIGVRFDFLINNTVYAQYPGFIQNINGLYHTVMYTGRYCIPPNFKKLNWGGGSDEFKGEMAQRKQTNVLIYTKNSPAKFRAYFSIISSILKKAKV